MEATPQNRTPRAPVVLAGVVAVTASLSLVGWHAGVGPLTRALPGYAPTQYNTALGVLLSALALLASARGVLRAGVIFGVVAGTLGGLTALEYLIDRSIGIDQIHFSPKRAVDIAHPGRMAAKPAIARFEKCAGPNRLHCSVAAEYRGVYQRLSFARKERQSVG